MIPEKDSPDQESTFKDVVSFVRELYGLGLLKEVPPKVLDSKWSKSLRKGPAPARTSCVLPPSDLTVALRQETNALLESMRGRRLLRECLPSSNHRPLRRVTGIYLMGPLSLSAWTSRLLSRPFHPCRGQRYRSYLCRYLHISLLLLSTRWG